MRSLPRGIRLSIRLAGDVERDEQAQVAKSGMLIDVEYTAAAHARDDAMVATLLGNDPTPCAQCTRIGDRHLLLAPGAEAKVRTALRKLGYALGPGTDSTRKASPTSCLAAIGGR